MKITDGKKTIDLRICEWNGSGWNPDWSEDYFSGSLPFDEDTQTYISDIDVDILVDVARGWDENGACGKNDADGNPCRNEDMMVFVEEIAEPAEAEAEETAEAES